MSAEGGAGERGTPGTDDAGRAALVGAAPDGTGAPEPAVRPEGLTSQEPSEETAAVTVPAPDLRSPWECALDELEAEVDRAEALVAPGFLLDSAQDDHVSLWTPPAGLGPLPAEHAERAAQILDRQADLVPRVEEAARAARTHLRAVGSLRTTSPTASVYVDAVG